MLVLIHCDKKRMYAVIHRAATMKTMQKDILKTTRENVLKSYI